MRAAGLVGRPPRRFRRTTVADPQAQAEDLVQRQFVAHAPDRLWFGDITYVRTWEGWLYLAVILDAYSRKVVGWAMADHLRTELATAALQMALETRRPKPGLIQHTDRGSQYTSAVYGELLTAHQARQSVGRPGTCWDSKNEYRWQALADLTRVGIDHGVLALTCRSDASLPPFCICRAVTL
jgi:transposase InsO family protein